MKGHSPPFTITIDHFPLFFCKKCQKYRPKSAFYDDHIQQKRRMCKTCRCRNEHRYRTKTPERRILSALRQRLNKINKALSRQWDVHDISKLLRAFNPTKNPARFTVVTVDRNKPFLPGNATLVSRSEAYRLARAR